MAATKKTAATTASRSKTKTGEAAKPAKKMTLTERTKNAEARAARAEAKMLRMKEQTFVKQHVNGFIDFLREQSVVGLAIGLVLGTQAKVLVDQIVASFINPLVGLLLPGEGTLKQKVFDITINGKTAVFGWGAFVSVLITFVIVAAVVYYVFRGLGLDKLDKPKKDA